MTARKGSMHAAPRVRVLQRKLYRAAKVDPKRTFGVLYDKVFSREVLWEAWERVKRNRGSAGIDGQTIEAIEASGVERFVDELQHELQTQRYRPQPVRRVYIPKADGRQRPLGIPRVKDRIAQAAVRIVIEPLFEASFRPRSYGFRPGRGTREAVEEIRKWVSWGRDEVIDLDLKSYFDTIDQDLLMKLVKRRVTDPRVLRLIRRWLRAGVMLEGQREETLVGTPQGGVISPLLANIYLHPLDLWWESRMPAAKLVRYADDMVVLCRKGAAAGYMEELRGFLARLAVTVNEEKTRIAAAGEGFDFLGLHFRKRPSRRVSGRYFCAAWPSRRSMQRIRDKVKQLVTVDTRPHLADVVNRLCPVLRGWGNYFRPYYSDRHFVKVDQYVRHKLVWWVRRKHRRRGYVIEGSRWDYFRLVGLYQLEGTATYGH